MSIATHYTLNLTPVGGTPPSLVQEAVNNDSGDRGTVTVDATDGWSTPTSGNLLIAVWAPEAQAQVPVGAIDDGWIPAHHLGNAYWDTGVYVDASGSPVWTYYKYSNGTESSITFTGSETNRHTALLLAEFSDTVGSGYPFARTMGNNISGPRQGASSSMPETTHTTASDTLVYCVGVKEEDAAGESISWTAPMVKQSDYFVDTPDDEPTAFHTATYEPTSAGSLNVQWTRSTASPDRAGLVTLEIKPAGYTRPTVSSAVVEQGISTNRQLAGIGTTSFLINASDGWSTPTSGNQLVMMALFNTSRADGMSPPSGWTEDKQLHTSDRSFIFSRVSDGTESSISFTTPLGIDDGCIHVFEISGLTNKTFVDATMNTYSAQEALPAEGGTTHGHPGINADQGIVLAGTRYDSMNVGQEPTAVVWYGEAGVTQTDTAFTTNRASGPSNFGASGYILTGDDEAVNVSVSYESLDTNHLSYMVLAHYT